jgi:hypothetical protein
MPDLPDLDLRPPDGAPRPPSPPPAGPPRRTALWGFAALLVVAAAVGGYLTFREKPMPAPAATAAPARQAPAPAPPANLGGTPEPIDVPPLDQSDALVRTLVRAISTHPLVEAWLTTRGLIRNFVVVVVNIANGPSPAQHLRPIAPRQAFRVMSRDGATVIDPRSYDRYNRIADAIGSIDAAGAARLYATLKPRIEEAARDLGEPAGSFDRTLERAIAVLLRTPVVDRPVRVVDTDRGYVYADDALEGLTAAQKQLLRTGPRNVRMIQQSLRDIAAALGVDAQALPPPPAR